MGRRSAGSRLSTVLLPAPLRPTSATFCPAAISRLKPREHAAAVLVGEIDVAEADRAGGDAQRPRAALLGHERGMVDQREDARRREQALAQCRLRGGERLQRLKGQHGGGHEAHEMAERDVAVDSLPPAVEDCRRQVRRPVIASETGPTAARERDVFMRYLSDVADDLVEALRPPTPPGCRPSRPACPAASGSACCRDRRTPCSERRTDLRMRYSAG